MSPKNARSFGMPGSEYMDRVGQAVLGAMTAQREVATAAWTKMQEGKYQYADMMQSLTEMMGGYYEMMIEVSRGPGFVFQPIWLYFDYKKGETGTPETLQDTVRISRTEAAQTELETTPLSSLQKEMPIANAYQSCNWAAGGRSQIQVALDKDVIDAAATGSYIGFIMPKGRTGEPPLVIVMLQIA
jgi:hypothetical protein